jgi:hypothetical protein
MLMLTLLAAAHELSGKILVIMPGMGNPMIEEKIDSLLDNIRVLPVDTEYLIFQYSVIPEELIAKLPMERIKFILDQDKSNGFAHRFLSLSESDYVVKNGYSHVLLLLDDIRMHSWMPGDLNIHPTEHEIFSPVLSEYNMTPWKFMCGTKNDEAGLVFTSDFLELFAFYMQAKTFMHYCKFLWKPNPWGWGVDLIKREHMHVHPVLFNDWKMDHWKLGTSTPKYISEDPTGDYLKMYGLTFIGTLPRETYREIYDLADFEMRSKPAELLSFVEGWIDF